MHRVHRLSCSTYRWYGKTGVGGGGGGSETSTLVTFAFRTRQFVTEVYATELRDTFLRCKQSEICDINLHTRQAKIYIVALSKT